MKKTLLLCCMLISITTLMAQPYSTEKIKDANGYTYETVKNDNTGTRIYTLKNGLKVYLAQNTDEPRIQTYIPVRTGSNNDPADNTGLAHYLEHMVFKGTSKIGTQNWDKEKVLIQQISDLYEKHKAETDPEKIWAANKEGLQDSYSGNKKYFLAAHAHSKKLAKAQARLK